MTDKEATKNLKGQIKCLKCETGIDCEKCRPNWSKEKDIEALEKAIEVLENQKTGHWISKPSIYGVVYCSECDYELHTNNTNYCANCGAKMKGVKQWN